MGLAATGWDGIGWDGTMQLLASLDSSRQQRFEMIRAIEFQMELPPDAAPRAASLWAL